MSKFNKRNIDELKKHLYDSYVHDSKIVSFECYFGKDSIQIELFNLIFNQRIKFIFNKIDLTLITKGNFGGSKETVSSLTAEENFAYLQKYVSNYNDFSDESIYMVFQFFSGNELHIVAQSVDFEIVK